MDEQSIEMIGDVIAALGFAVAYYTLRLSIQTTKDGNKQSHEDR